MAIVDRVKGIILKPADEWTKIADEPTGGGALFKGYAVPLAAIGPVAGLIGGSLIGKSLPFIGTYRVGLAAGLAAAVATFVMALVGVFVLSLIIDALAPSFGGQKNKAQALKVAVYSYTPAWVAGALQILPMLGVLALLGALYGIYLLYLGLPRLMKCPQEKAIGYTAVVLVCAIVLSLVIGAVAGLVMRPALFGGGPMADLSSRMGGSGSVRFDKDSAFGKLQAMGEAAQESARKMEEAQKSGDPSAAAAAAMQGVGAMLSGGKHVEPIGIDQLKLFVPESFAGLSRLGSSADKTGAMGLMISKAAATYGDHASKNVSLTVSDTGGASALLGVAAWMRVQGEHEDENGFERTTSVDGRLVHEKGSKSGSPNEIGIVLGQRFVVSAHATGIDFATLKSAVMGLDLGKLEAMKDVGVTK